MYHIKVTYRIILFAGILVLFYDKALGQSDKLSNYKIEITESGMLFTTSWEITNETISVEKWGINNFTDTFSKSLSQTEAKSIVYLLKKINLGKNKKDTVKNFPDDMYEYDFKISIGSQTKKFHIYNVKVEEVFKLVQYINGLLPKNYHIGYDEEYFKNLR